MATTKTKTKTSKSVEMGCEAKHLVTGEIGILTGQLWSLNGVVQYCFKRQDRDKNGKPFDEKWLDEAIFERIGDGLVDRVKAPASTDIELGMTVKHFNGFTGVATEKLAYFNGCTHIGVMSKTKNPDKMPDMQYVPCQYLSIVRSVKKVIAQQDDTGGPSSNAPCRM